MSLTLYMHPLSSYCHKALIAFYENDTPFKAQSVDLGNETERENLRRLWPLAKFPLLRDEATGRTIPESTMIIEYLAQHYPGRSELVPEDPELAWQVRFADRFYDLHVHAHMQRIVFDRVRPDGKQDPFIIEMARANLRTAYEMIDNDMQSKTWVLGDTYTMADCAASPALFYAARLVPFDQYKNLSAYFARLLERPSYARVLREAEPFMKMFPA
jgi:glutathione S-transferase